jgi:hypothetical protein
MTKIDIIRNLTDEDLVEICDTFCSASDYLRSIHAAPKGNYTAIINSRRKSLNLEWRDDPNKIQNKECPVCNTLFKPNYKTQATCSHGCSNTFFRSGTNNGNFKGTRYRTICFNAHEKVCIVCGEDKIVSVHHYDENNKNNSIDNLVPLCPTHHQYVHSRYKHLVQHIIEEWVESVKNSS